MLINSIRELINVDCIVRIDEENNSVTLRENGANATLNPINIRGVNQDDLVFKLDCSGYLSPYLNKAEPDILKACDYIIIALRNNQHHIIYCELKSRTEKKYAKQMRNSVYFVNWLREMALEYKGHQADLKESYVLFSKKNRKPKLNGKFISKPTDYGFSVKLAGEPHTVQLSKLTL